MRASRLNLAEGLHRQARLLPDHPALAVGTSEWASYSSLSRSVTQLAGFLRQLEHWRPGSPVVLLMENRPAFWETLFATWHAGGCAVPLNSKLHPNEVASIITDCSPSIIVTSRRLGEAAHRALSRSNPQLPVLDVDSSDYCDLRSRRDLAVPLAERHWEDPAWIFFTSGTTGRAKGAVLSHGNLAAMCAAYYADIDSVQPADRFVHAAPVSHGSGLYGLPFFLKGATNVLPESGTFDAAETSELIASWSRASLFLAPTMLNRIVQSDELVHRARGHLQTLVYGGGPMYRVDLERALDRLGPCVAQIYGQGETPMTITALAKWQHQPLPSFHAQQLSSVGTERFGTRVRVVDDNGCDATLGQSGEIIVRGDTVMLGYLNDPRATAETLRDGWLYTGDIGSFDDRGYLTLHDRSKDVVISGGSNIYPREVEEVLRLHAGVAEVAVFGLPDAQWGEVVACAYAPVSASTTNFEAELDALCLEHIARFKRPKRYVRLAALPKNNYGKILKRELVRMLAEEPRSG